MKSFHTEAVTGYHIDSDHPGLYSCGTGMVDLFFLHPMYIVTWAFVFSPVWYLIFYTVKKFIDMVFDIPRYLFNIPQYFKDLKDSRDKETCKILREELREEVEKQMRYRIECKDLQIEKLTKEKKNIKEKLEKIESWIYKRQSDINDADTKKYRASKEIHSFISCYDNQTFGDIT